MATAHHMWDLSSLIRNRTQAPHFGRWSFNHWMAGEVPKSLYDLSLRTGPLKQENKQPPNHEIEHSAKLTRAIHSTIYSSMKLLKYWSRNKSAGPMNAVSCKCISLLVMCATCEYKRVADVGGRFQFTATLSCTVDQRCDQTPPFRNPLAVSAERSKLRREHEWV